MKNVINLFKNYRIFKLILSLPIYVIPFFLVILLIILYPIILIRLFGINSHRIGHFAGNIEVYLTKKKAKIDQPNKKYYDICFYDLNTSNEWVCNKQLDKMVKRILRIYPTFPFYYTRKLIEKLKPYFKFLSRHLVTYHGHDDRDYNHLFNKFDSSFYLTKPEIENGDSILKKMGIPKNSEFVCFTVRDSAYLKSKFTNHDFSYHDHRDCNIENHLLAAETLAANGYYVLRMGKVVSSKLSSKNSMIIDYANSEFKSDFMDIYLGANCKFIVTTQTGYDAIPYVFRKPAAIISVPIGEIRSFKYDTLTITKHHFDQGTNKYLSMREIFDYNLGFSLRVDDFKKKNIKLIENSNIEINDLVIDMLNELKKPKDKQFILTEKQKEFNQILDYYNKKYKIKYLHNKLLGSFANSFLSKNLEFLK